MLSNEYNRFNFKAGMNDYEIHIYPTGYGQVYKNNEFYGDTNDPCTCLPGLVSACCWTTSPSLPTIRHMIFEFSFPVQGWKEMTVFSACDPVGPVTIYNPAPPEPPSIVTSGPSAFPHVIDGRFTDDSAECTLPPVPSRGYQEPVRDPFFDEYDGGVGWTIEFDTQNGGVIISMTKTTHAWNPKPDDGAKCVKLPLVLSWSPGCEAASHDVYFGTNFDDVDNALHSSPKYKGNQDVNSYSPGSLEPCST